MFNLLGKTTGYLKRGRRRDSRSTLRAMFTILLSINTCDAFVINPTRNSVDRTDIVVVITHANKLKIMS